MTIHGRDEERIYNFSRKKREGKIPPGRPRHRWHHNVL